MIKQVGNFLIPGILLFIALGCIVPMPTAIIDILVTANFAAAIVLIAGTFSTQKVVHLSTFPTIILYTTLIRIALNVSTTKIILQKLEVGSFVKSVGNLMTQGDPIVGLLIFLVVSVVQFVVITKGAERVAEVSARFTLDGIPGKQMAIESSLRSGNISVEEAEVARDELELETKLYGALDGTMKFVKGDSIAGFIILAINLLGSVSLGVLRHGSTVSEALAHGANITIGDGLVAQIPAVLNAVAAGIIVTKVCSEESSAVRMLEQLRTFTAPQIGVGVLLAAFACVPGAPTLPLVVVGLFFALGGVANHQMKLKRQRAVESEQKPPPVNDLIVIFLPRTLITEYSHEVVLGQFQETMNCFLKETGVPINRVRFLPTETNRYAMLLRNATLCELEITEQEEVLSTVAATTLEAFRSIKTELIDDITTHLLLEQHRSVYSLLIDSIMPSVCTVTQLTSMLRSLVEDDIPLNDFDIILQSIGEYAPQFGVNEYLIEQIRSNLARSIALSLTDQQPLPVLAVDPTFDFQILKLQAENKAMDPGLIELLYTFIGEHHTQARTLVCSPGSRATLGRMARNAPMPVRVMSTAELQFAQTALKATLTLPAPSVTPQAFTEHQEALQ